MNLQETIRRILMEENPIPRNIMRRIDFSDLSPLMKKNSLRYSNKNGDFDLSIELGAKFTATDLIPFHDENGRDYVDVDYDDWVKTLKNYLIETFGNETKEYLEKVFPPDSFQDDGYSYAIWKHADRNGGSGFSEGYNTWGDLLLHYSFWFPIEWWEVKSKLDKMDKGTLLIQKPGDEFNKQGYYFSIIKTKKNLRESIKKILRESSSEIKLRRLLQVIDDLIESGLKKQYSKKNLKDTYLVTYENSDEFVDVMADWIVERMYYDYFSNLEHNSEEWEKIYHMINQYIFENWSERLKEHYNSINF